MKKLILLPLILYITEAFSQNRFVIQLTDKNNSPYSISNPSAYLSPKSIARRTAQNISIDQSDLPVNPAYLTGIANTGAIILNKSKWLNTVSIMATDSTVIAAINSLPYVSSTKIAGRPGIPGKTDGKSDRLTPLNVMPLAARVSNLDYGFATNQVLMLNGQYLHNQGFKGEGMVIAVMDAGFLNVDTLACFDKLRNENRILGTWDFVNSETDVYQDDSHGAMVLSLMAADLPGQIIGTAPNADYWLFRTEDGGSEFIIEEYNWASAAEFADSAGVDLINTSLGYTVFWDSTQNHTYTDMDGNTTPITIAADMAASKGILVENSAGNEGNSQWNYIGAPADGDSVMATGAVDSAEFYATFSSNGPSFDGRIKPNIAAQGQGAYVYLPWGGGVAAGSGTSFSGPIMTGMAACLWQAFPGMNNMQIIRAIERSASQFTNPDTLLGYGIPDFQYAKTLLAIEAYGADYTSDQLVSIGPNPFSDDFTFTFFSIRKQDATVEIFDMLGRQAYKNIMHFNAMSLNKISVNPHLQGKGVYVFRIRTGEGNFSKRVIKD